MECEQVRPTTDQALQCEPEHGCITCGDEAVALRVMEVDTERVLALCESETGDRETVEVGLVGPVGPGDEVLVHAGTAIALLPDPQEARA